MTAAQWNAVEFVEARDALQRATAVLDAINPDVDGAQGATLHAVRLVETARDHLLDRLMVADDTSGTQS